MSSNPPPGEQGPEYGRRPAEGYPPPGGDQYPGADGPPGHPQQGGYPPGGYPQQGYPQQGGGYPAGGYPPGEGHPPPAGYPSGGYYPPGGYPEGGYYPPGGGNPPPGGFPAATADPLVSVSFGDWWSKVIGVIRRSWKSLLIIQIATVVPVLVLVTLLGLLAGVGVMTGVPQVIAPGVVVVVLVSVVVIVAVALLAQGASVFVAVREAVGRPVQPSEALSFAAGRALPLLGWGILAGLMIAIGFILLVLPGLYLLVVFGSALTGAIMFEHRGIGRAFELANAKFWPMAGRVLSFMLAAAIYNAVVGAIIGSFLQRDGVAYSLIVNILTVPVTLATVGVAIVAYAELRHHENPAVTSPVLDAELRA